MEEKYTLVCLGAGTAQTPIIKTAKNIGFTVIACDIDSNAPGFIFSDYQIIKSTHNFNSIIKSILTIQSKYKDIGTLIGILNRSSGPPVISAAKISEHFNLPGVPFESANSILNKDLLRKNSERLGIINPEYQIINVDELNSKLSCSYPVLVKPSLSMVGKSGISIVRSNNELASSIDYAKKFTINNKIIIEEYLNGTDYSFIGFIEKGKLHKVCILEEINIENKDGSISGRGFKTLTGISETDLENKINTISKKIIDGLCLQRTPFMSSFRSDSNGNVYLIEIHLDIGGDTLIENLFPVALDIDFKELAVRMAAGMMDLPLNITVKPSVVFFEKGNELVSKKKSKVLTANSQKELDMMVNDEK